MMCAMRIQHEITYQAPVERVYVMLTDPAFRQTSCDAQGALSADTRAIQTEEWSDGAQAAFSVKTPGKPTEINGRLTLSVEGGSTVESFLAELFRAGMDNEHTAGVAWLKGTAR